MAVNFYHATTEKAARAIELSEFRPGSPEKRRYAGAGIYFSDNKNSAIRHCFNGAALKGDRSKKAEVVIICNVDFGWRLDAEKYTVDKDMCFARGYDSVHSKGTDTYAVYDSARISIQKFVRIADNECWYPSAASAAPLDIMIAAIKASPAGSLNVTSDVSQLCLKHPSLHQALRAVGGVTGFCEAHPELIRDGRHLRISSTALKASTPLKILVAAIYASCGSLNVTSDISQLCSKHPDLHEALRAVGGLRAFCKVHPEIVVDGVRCLLGVQ